MNFREAAQIDLDFVEANPLHKTMQYKQPEKVDYCFTLEDGDEILGVGGFRFISETTAWAWFILSKYAEKNLFTVYRVIKEWMEIFCDDKGIRRLQAYVNKDSLKAVRTVEHLGFEKESTMRNFLPDNKSAYMYVKFSGA